MAWDQHIASSEIIKTHKVLSKKLKEKCQFGYKDVDGRATLKLKHTHITEGGRKGNRSATILAPGSRSCHENI